MNANLDDLDSSQDDDYVPDAKALKQSDKELIKQNGAAKDLLDDQPKSGIELLKQKKREKETDDLWDLMNCEDDFYASKKKALKTHENQEVKAEVKQTGE